MRKAFFILLILLFSLMAAPLAAQFPLDCASLGCSKQGKICSYAQEGGTACVAACKDERNIALGEVGYCSIDNRYCGANGTTRFKCDVCGCPKGNQCGADGICAPICEDGTRSGKCADSPPRYCQDGRLTDNSQVCGCDEGKVAQSDGSCGFGGAILGTSATDFEKGSSINLTITRKSPLNLALSGKGFSSSNLAAPDWPYQPSPEFLNDQQLTYAPDWVSEPSQSSSNRNQFIGIEWDEPQTFNEILLVQSLLFAKSLKVQYLKGNDWIDATSVISLENYPDNLPEYKFNYNLSSSKLARFDPVNSTKIRVIFPECYYVCRVYELEVYNSEESSLKLASTSGEHTSEVFDTGITNNNITYLLFEYTTSVSTPAIRATKNIAPEAAVNFSSVYSQDSPFNGKNINTETFMANGFVTGWGPQVAVNQWASFSFLEDKTISAIEISEMQSRIGSFIINTKEGGKWKNIERFTVSYPAVYDPAEPIYTYKGRTLYSFEPVTTREIQLFFPDARGGPWLHQVKIFEQAKESKQANIALEAAAIASSTYAGNSNIGKGAVNDGNPDSSAYTWVQSAEEFNKPAWIGLEWPTPRTINSIRIALGRPTIPCFQYYRLEYWDATDWKTIVRQYNKGTPDDFGLACSPASDGYEVFGIYNITERFPAVKTTKIRLIPEPNWYGYASVREIEAYEPVAESDNIAPNGTAVVSSSANGQNINSSYLNNRNFLDAVATSSTNAAKQGTLEVGACPNCNSALWGWLWIAKEAINNGDISGPKIGSYNYQTWAAGGAWKDLWLTLTYPQPKTFTSIGIAQFGDYLGAYRVMYWENGGWSYRTMPSFSPSGTWTIKYTPSIPLNPPITTEKIGLKLDSSYSNYAPFISEFEAFASNTLPKVWKPSPSDPSPKAYIQFPQERDFTSIAFVEETGNIQDFQVAYWAGGQWNYIQAPSLISDSAANKITEFTLPSFVRTDKIGIQVLSSKGSPSLREFFAFASPIIPPKDLSGNIARFQIRSAPNEAGQPGEWTDWIGSDGTIQSYFTQSGQAIPPIHNGNKFFQYRALASTGITSQLTQIDEVKASFAGKFNIKPLVSTADKDVILGESASFVAIGNDIGGSIIRYDWDFGDGSFAEGKSVTHLYASPGAYAAKVTATDNDGGTGSANANVFVNVYDCLTPSSEGAGTGAGLLNINDPIIQQAALAALREYADKSARPINSPFTVMELYEAANDYISKHMTYLPDTPAWDGVSSKKLLTESGSRCGNDYCGDCEDFAITTASLIRALGVSDKCVYVACSKSHCFNILNINSKFRIVEPQQNSLKAQFNSFSYDWVDDQGNPNYASTNLFNDHVGKYYIVDDSAPAPYTFNYPGTNGLPDPARPCKSYASWKGEGDKSYFEDICP